MDLLAEIFTRDNAPVIFWVLSWGPVLPFMAWKVRGRKDY